MMKNIVGEYYNIIKNCLTQDLKITLKGVTYYFGVVYTQEEKDKQDRIKNKVARSITQDYFKNAVNYFYAIDQCRCKYDDCSCGRKYWNKMWEIDSIPKKKAKNKPITYLQPEVIEESQCFAFNHMTDEEQEKIIKDLGKHHTDIFVYPCTNPECALPEVIDDEIKEFLVHIKNVTYTKE
ncbi:MAG: hypothetical protein ACRDL7_04160 [Gaiellaceae bacterium]